VVARSANAAGALVLALALIAPAQAWADGAFPDELQVFAPEDQPGRIVLGTNYGLILSADDGASWSYVCEAAVSQSLVSMYGVGPGSLYALTNQALYTSHDEGCTWTGANLAAAGISSSVDVFGDPARDDHAFVITYTSGARGFELYDVDDGGLQQVYASGNSLLRGVEVARSDPRVVYAARFRLDSSAVELLVSGDSGQTFTAIEHPELGAYYPGIAAVDPADPATLYLRLTPLFDTGDALAVSHDSGQTFTVVLTAPGDLSAFAVDTTHAFYAADRAHDLWYGDAAGVVTLRAGPAVRCLAARAGKVYACGDAAADGFVLGVSTDHGVSFSPLVTPTSYQTAACAPVRAVCPLIDGGPMPEPDAGAEPADSGVELDAGPTDAGAAPVDAGRAEMDAGLADGGARAGPGPAQGCGCTGGDGGLCLAGLVFALGFTSAFSGRRRRTA